MKIIFHPKYILLVAILICLTGLVILLQTPRGRQKNTTFYNSTSTENSSSLPAFSSASFVGSDPIASLGPEWTLLRQADLKENDGKWVSGTTPQRETLAKIIGKNTSLLIVELRILDKKKVQDAIKNGVINKISLAAREAYLIPMNDMEGSTGLLLLGSENALIIKHGVAANWPLEKDLDPEIISYLVNVHVL